MLAPSKPAPRIQAEEDRTHRWRIKVRLRPCDGARGRLKTDRGLVHSGRWRREGGVYSDEESGERGSVVCVETNRGKEGSSKVARLKDLLSSGR